MYRIFEDFGIIYNILKRPKKAKKARVESEKGSNTALDLGRERGARKKYLIDLIVHRK